MKAKNLLTLLALGVLMSCQDPDPKPKRMRSFELHYSNGADTINIIDAYGRRQGVWLTHKEGEDTTVYLNDTAYSAKGTTVRALIKSLNEKQKGRYQQE